MSRGAGEPREVAGISAARRYERLPKGKQRLAPEVAAESQRRRLLLAAVELFAEQGYGRLTSRAIARRARVSAATFYVHFACLEDCLAAAAALAADCVEEIAAGCGEEGTGSGLEAVLAFLAAEPELGRLLGDELRQLPAVAARAALLRSRLAERLASRRGSIAAGPAEQILVGAAIALVGSGTLDLSAPALAGELAELLALGSSLSG